MTDHAQRELKTEFADILNALNDMQQSFMYAARRDELQRAERLIVQLEQERNEARTQSTQAHAKGRRAGLEEAAKLASSLAGKAHTYASENADVYYAYDDGLRAAAQAIRAKAKEGT